MRSTVKSRLWFVLVVFGLLLLLAACTPRLPRIPFLGGAKPTPTKPAVVAQPPAAATKAPVQPTATQALTVTKAVTTSQMAATPPITATRALTATRATTTTQIVATPVVTTTKPLTPTRVLTPTVVALPTRPVTATRAVTPTTPIVQAAKPITATPVAPVTKPITGQLTLVGTPWKLTSYLDYRGRTAAVPAGSDVTAELRDGKIAGKSGCNSYTGTYTITGNSLKAQAGAATRMACPEAVMLLERTYLLDLGAVRSYRIIDRKLELLNSGGRVLLTFNAVESASLTRTN